MNFEGWAKQRLFSVQLLCREVSRVGIKIQPDTQKCVGDPHKSNALRAREREGESC